MKNNKTYLLQGKTSLPWSGATVEILHDLQVGNLRICITYRFVFLNDPLPLPKEKDATGTCVLIVLKGMWRKCIQCRKIIPPSRKDRETWKNFWIITSWICISVITEFNPFPAVIREKQETKLNIIIKVTPSWFEKITAFSQKKNGLSSFNRIYF